MMWLLNMAHASSFAPTAATKIAEQWDNLYGFLLISSTIASLILIGGMIYFVLKYKRKTNNDKTAYISHNSFLEFLWSFIPLCIFLAVFAWGWYLYHQMRKMPENALEIHVRGKQWAWEAEYKSGVKTSNLIVAPIGTDVRLIMSSLDVLHSFYVPSFRIKQDVVPGMYTSLWFNADKMGEFHIFCAEFCGSAHSGMLGVVKVVSREEFDTWLNEESKFSTLPLAQRGEKIFQIKACASCHSVQSAEVDKATKVGPRLFQLFGRTEKIDGLGDLTVDENYIRESILNPSAKIVSGYAKGVMPTFQGQISEAELTAIVEYLKGLK